MLHYSTSPSQPFALNIVAMTVATGVAAGIAGASAAKPKCAAQITVAATTQFSTIGQGRLLNAANRPARGAALQALSKGQ